MSFQRDIVIAKLTEFYKKHCPTKSKFVSEVYEAYKFNLPGLFDELLRVYPQAPANSFDDVVELLRANKQQPRPTEVIPLNVLSSLITDGQKLLDQSPATLGRDDAHGGTSERIDEEVIELDRLIQENIALAREVAMAEQQVLQRRLRVLLAKVLRSPDASRPKSLTLQICDGKRELHVPMNHALWQFVVDGILHTPTHPQARMYEVRSSHLGITASVNENIITAAMREWSRQDPHTVSELLDGRWRYHSSSFFWWQFPVPPRQIECIAPRQMFATPDAWISSTGPSDTQLFDAVLKRTGNLDVTEDILRLFGGRAFDFAGRAARGGDGGDATEFNADGFWTYFLDQWDLLHSSTASC